MHSLKVTENRKPSLPLSSSGRSESADSALPGEFIPEDARLTGERLPLAYHRLVRGERTERMHAS